MVFFVFLGINIYYLGLYRDQSLEFFYTQAFLSFLGLCASQGFLEFRVLGLGFCCVPMVYGLHIFRNQSLALWVLLGFKIVFRDFRVDFRVYRIQGFLRIRVEGFLGLYVQDLGFPKGFFLGYGFWVKGFIKVFRFQCFGFLV